MIYALVMNQWILRYKKSWVLDKRIATSYEHSKRAQRQSSTRKKTCKQWKTKSC